MTREQMLEAIYDQIADKTLSLGCVFTAVTEVYYTYVNDNYVMHNGELKFLYPPKRNIYGHPVMIGDVLDWMPKGPDYFQDIIPIVDLRTEMREPIDNQIYQCIECVYNLIQEQDDK